MAYTKMEPTRDELIAAMKEAESLAREYWDECGGCDHSVGICACSVHAMWNWFALMVKRLEGTAPMCDKHGLIVDEFCLDCEAEYLEEEKDKI